MMRFGARTPRTGAPIGRNAAALQRYKRLYDYWWRYRTTGLGKAFIIGLLLSGSIGSASIVMPIFRLFCALGALLGVALVAAWLLRPKLTLSATLPEKAVAGQKLHVDLIATNAGRFAARNIQAGFFNNPPSLVGDAGPVSRHIAPGEQSRLSAFLQPLRRGSYGPLRLRAWSTFPLNLYRTPCAKPVGGSLLVLPAFHGIGGVDIPVGARYQPGGIALTSNVGESPEYIGNREYRFGDSMKRIDFKAWARLARPAVREYQEEYYCRIALVLDTFVPKDRKAGPEGFPDLEAAVSLCASVADALAQGEYIIDLFAAGPELYVFRAGRHTAHFENVLEILACVEACRTNPFEKVTPALADELSNISALVAVCLDWDASRARLVQTARDHGCSVKLLVVRDSETTESLSTVDVPFSVFTPGQISAGEIETL